jgi:hypothetical protein
MTAVKQYNAERLAFVRSAPVVSEKATFIADNHEQLIFKGRAPPPRSRK